MASEVATILLLIANILKNVPFLKTTTADDEDDENEEESNVKKKRAINLPWLIRRLRYVVHAEVAKAPQSIILVNRHTPFL